MEILLIEGEPRTATFLMRGLAAEGFQVAQSGSGRAAVERALEHRFDVVVLDLVLHGMNGFDVLKLLHAERPNLPVILLLGQTDLDTKIRGFELGASDFLEKPFALGELVARVYVHSRERNGRSTQSRPFTVGALSEDGYVTRYCSRTHTPCYVIVPALIDHDLEQPSIYKNARTVFGRERRAAVYDPTFDVTAVDLAAAFADPDEDAGRRMDKTGLVGV